MKSNQDEKQIEKDLKSMKPEELLKLIAQKDAKIKELQSAKEPPKIKPSDLVGSFIDAIDTMREKGTTPKEKPVNYRVSKLDLIIKSGIGIDEKNEVKLLLPKAGESPVFTPEQLSTIQFSISAVPKVKEKRKDEK
jgi:hypothetical protein